MGRHKQKELSKEEMEELRLHLQDVEKASDLRRLQCVYFRGLGQDIEQISSLVQLSVGHIKSIWTLYFKEGLEGLKVKPRGGRRRFNLTLEDEKKLLSQYAQNGENGVILEIGPLYQGLCQAVGHTVGIASAYRLAHRHGWRKISPRPRHPGKKEKAAEYFKVFFS